MVVRKCVIKKNQLAELDLVIFIIWKYVIFLGKIRILRDPKYVLTVHSFHGIPSEQFA